MALETMTSTPSSWRAADSTPAPTSDALLPVPVLSMMSVAHADGLVMMTSVRPLAASMPMIVSAKLSRLSTTAAPCVGDWLSSPAGGVTASVGAT
jgi:hypothetical protein